MMKGNHGPAKLLHVLTWGAFDNASHAPQIRACTCNYLVLPIIIIAKNLIFLIADIL